MSNSISNLLIRNLRDVFGENDPKRVHLNSKPYGLLFSALEMQSAVIGRTFLLVRPVSGSGEQWVEESRVSGFGD